MVAQSLSVRNITRMINFRQYNFLEQLIVTEPVNFLALVEPKGVFLYSQEPSPRSSTNQWNLVCTFTFYLTRPILILSPYLCLHKPSNVFSIAFYIKIVLEFLISYI